MPSPIIHSLTPYQNLLMNFILKMKVTHLFIFSLLLFGYLSKASAQIGGPNGSGQWSGIIQMPIVPVAAANLPDGKVLTWSAYDRFAFGGNRGKTYTAIFDPATNTSQELLVSNTQHDMFCPGTSTLPDGKIIVTGGSSSNKTSIYDPFTQQWVSGAAMVKPRGYHSMVTLSNGSVFTIGGSWSGGAGNKHGEIYENGSWRLLNGVPVNVILDGATDPAGVVKNDNFPWLWPAPNGKIFHAGPSEKMHWIDANGNGSYSNAGARGDDAFAYAGTTVMYDAGKILKTGGAASYGDGRAASGTTYIIDITGNQAQVEKVQNLAYPRNKHNTVVLPNGEILAIGGLGVAREFSDQQSRLIPEIFNPTTKSWRSLAPMQVPRNYHSIALLLPDGRVMAGGGGLCGGCTVNHPDVEIFSPPYLFNANGSLASRPTITNNPSQFANSNTEIVTTNSAISSFSLIRYNVATHSTNNDQRRVGISSTALGNNRYELNIPDVNTLPPGYYMLFAMNANGTPSVAKVIQVFNALAPPVNPGGSGLTANYFNNKDFTAPVFNRVDQVINFNWGTGSPASSMGADTYSVRWEGSIVAPYTGTFNFFTETDDGVRLWVNGQLIIDKWIPQGPTEWSGSINLVAGQQTSIKMEYYEEGGGAVARLRWAGPNTTKQIIPKDYLLPTGTVYTPQKPSANFTATPTSGVQPLAVAFDASTSSDPDGSIASYAWDFGDGNTATGVTASHTYTQTGSFISQLIITDQGGNKDTATQNIEVGTPPLNPGGSGLTANYFNTMNFTAPALSRVDPIINFNWGTASPDPSMDANTFSVRWEGGIVAPYTGSYTFFTETDDGVRLWVNGQIIIDKWVNQGSTEHSASINLNEGEQVSIKMEYFENGGAAVALLRWSGPFINKQIIAKDYLFPDGSFYTPQTPVASLTANPTSGTAPLVVSFDASASADPDGTIASYVWDFGDGTTASGATASHTFTQAGTFTVNLTVTDQGGNTDDENINIVVSEAPIPPNASFTATPTNGEAPLPVAFDASASTDNTGIQSYSWDFGDGNTGTGVSTSHTYALAGTYTATLTVTDQGGLTDNASVNIVVTEVVDPPSGDECFVVSGSQEVWIEAENFHAQIAGSGNAAASNWVVFNDPAVSEAKALRAEPNSGVYTGLDVNGPRVDYHVYFSQPGSYTVYVRGQGLSGSDDSFHAGLNGSPLTNTAGWGMIVPTAWTWTNEANDAQEIVLNIPSAGKYTLNLWMREDGVAMDKIHILPSGGAAPAGAGASESSTADCDNVSPVNSAPTASFSASPTSGTAPLAVNFDASASTDDNGITSYSWDFGDGSLGNGVNTSHSYTNPGQYVATLTVSDQEGLTNSTTQNILVQSANNGNCFAELNGQVVIEAEDFSRVNPGSGNAAGTSWTVIGESDASGASAVEAGPNTGLWTGLNLNGPRLDYDIEFSETGIYFVYIRSKGPTGNDDSYHIGLNGSGISNLSAFGMGGSGPWAWQSIANDDEVMQLNIQSVGKQTFNIWVREDGVQIDKIVIKKVSGNPLGQGPAASQQSPCGGNANQAPVASFTATPSTGAAPLQVNADATTSTDPDGSITSYAWDFGDGSQASGQTASHTYTSVGTYTLRLTVTDNEGLTNSSTRTINATPPANGPLCFEEKNGSVVIEAENFSSTSPGSGNASSNSWQKFTDINASNSEGVKAIPNNGTWTGLNINGPRLDYKILFQTAGTYRVYIRTQGPSNQDDSYHIGLNGSAVSTTSGYGMGWTGNWGWADFANDDNFVEVVVPSTGEHTFNIWMREDGVEIDKIVLKIQPGTPSGQGPVASGQLACASSNGFASNNKSFSMKESGGNGQINWGNFFEEFKDNYILERSIDGVTYESLESDEIIVDQLQNSHTDPQIRQFGVGAVFYRLRIRDHRGITRETRRGVLKVGSEELLFNFKLYPNPATDKLNLEFDNASGKALNLTVINSLGQSIYTDQIEGDQTDGMIKLDVSDYAQGIYFVRLSDNDKSQIVRVLVE